jgi:hypothetical protein
MLRRIDRNSDIGGVPVSGAVCSERPTAGWASGEPCPARPAELFTKTGIGVNLRQIVARAQMPSQGARMNIRLQFSAVVQNLPAAAGSIIVRGPSALLAEKPHTHALRSIALR